MGSASKWRGMAHGGAVGGGLWARDVAQLGPEGGH